MVLIINVKHHDNQISGEGNEEGESWESIFPCRVCPRRPDLITSMLIFGDTD